jgi:pimeloyl-ACP methyl ester carboxylesterase
VTRGAAGAEALGAAPPPAAGIDLSLPGAGMRLAATRWAGHGQPVVLLHGLASQRRFWNLVVPHLAGLPVLAVDQRGHGDSARPPDGPAGYAFRGLAADLATGLDALGWSRVVLVGHSWGAAVAATFAAEHPERSLALVAVDGGFTAPGALSDDRAEIRRLLEPPRIALPPDDLVAMLRDHTPARTWNDEVASAVLPIFAVGADGLARARLAFDDHMAIVDTLLDYDPFAVLSRVRCPTWLVSCGTGGSEEWSAAKASGLERARSVLSNARTFTWPDAVHDVPLQWPALVAGLVRAAVEDVAAPGPAGP